MLSMSAMSFEALREVSRLCRTSGGGRARRALSGEALVVCVASYLTVTIQNVLFFKCRLLSKRPHRIEGNTKSHNNLIFVAPLDDALVV